MTTNTPADEAVPAPVRRIDLMEKAPDFYKAMFALDKAAALGLDPVVRELVRVRISQLNGCAYCVDKHSADARKTGVSEQKLYGVTVWRETPFFTARERAALALAEAMTHLGEHGVPDDVYDEAAKLFDEDELPRLIAMGVAMNAWNRIGVTCRMSPAPRP
ncbi:carboxymuconolactone decarboxylase family protein [Streptomyces cocklensis]|jgi:AhpD family alkylhydroperoxidase|uniref:Alkylhydroperoxidase AhpD family core domain-containing protein n=1 Tax=Actinacidiphila cocklensis TaxID=887465 RepID=A0A9W4GVF3_9ACTN|nr:carboxymuconolactone decarboxylase family protein [Actinacidiphila cocklensis]MDD1060898.1 carboxymuconolactone decarboxylase family protein [Actinacidiphila cocklensis]WSX77227.1 carboxymuconolactone decarboxylase family protein [Streptomyces sp. NBC_00899]CAG6396667.1 Alkylhydroperoxidase AhpD family core domain-containing protein [Actinacidiphila cocklensis]